MRWIRFAALIIITAIIQEGLINILAVTQLNVKPDLLIILLVFFAIYSSTYEAIIISFTIGFLADLIGHSAMGPHMLSFGILGTLLAYLVGIITVRKMPHQALLIFITTLLTNISTHLLNALKIQQNTQNPYTVIFGIALYSAILGPFLFLPFAWWMRIKTQQLSKH